MGVEARRCSFHASAFVPAAADHEGGLALWKSLQQSLMARLLGFLHIALSHAVVVRARHYPHTITTGGLESCTLVSNQAHDIPTATTSTHSLAVTHNA